MDNKLFYRRMVSLALPIALQNLLSSCGYLVDTAMVVGLGNVATSAIGVASRWSFLTNVAVFGVCSGCSALSAQYWGAGDKEHVRKASGMAISAVALLSAVYIAAAIAFPRFMMSVFTSEEGVISAGLGYISIASFNMLFSGLALALATSMRSTGDVKSPFIASTVAVAVNIFFNYALINGHFGFPRMGIRGAALATVISGFVQLAVTIGLALAKKSVFLGTAGQMFGWGRDFIKKYASLALPILFNEILWALGTTIYSMVLARQGSENYSGYTIFNSIHEVFFVFFVGLCNACAIMIGMTIGENKLEEAYKMAKKYLATIFFMSVFLGAAQILLREPILSLMNIETEGAHRVASQLLVMHGILMPLVNLPYVAVVGVFRAGGDAKYGFFVDTFSVYAIGIPILVYAAYMTDATFVQMVTAMYLGEYVLKTVLCLLRFKSRKWIRRLV